MRRVDRVIFLYSNGCESESAVVSPQIVLEFTGLDVEAVVEALNGCRWIRKQLDGYVP